MIMVTFVSLNDIIFMRKKWWGSFSIETKQSIRILSNIRIADTGNINTATMEQLKTIKNIGQIRVSLILAEREKKGHLNLTDLK
jgi:hypothetical protein